MCNFQMPKGGPLGRYMLLQKSLERRLARIHTHPFCQLVRDRIGRNCRRRPDFQFHLTNKIATFIVDKCITTNKVFTVLNMYTMYVTMSFRQLVPAEPPKRKRVTFGISSDIERQFIVACIEGDVDVAEQSIKRGATVNRAYKNGVTPLWVACQNDHLDVVELLLRNGADPNISDFEGKSPLYIVCQKRIPFNYRELNLEPIFQNRMKIVELLLRNGANVNHRCENLTTPLYIALSKSNYRIASVLLSSPIIEITEIELGMAIEGTRIYNIMKQRMVKQKEMEAAQVLLGLNEN